MARPPEGERAGEARAPRSPPSAGGGAAADGASGARFSFFAMGASLFKRSNHQASSAERETKDQGSSAYGSSPVSSGSFRPNFKPNNQLEGSTSEAEGVAADYLGVGAAPRGISPVLSFFGIGGKLPPPCSSSSSSSSLGERRRAQDLRRGRGALDSPSVASE